MLRVDNAKKPPFFLSFAHKQVALRTSHNNEIYCQFYFVRYYTPVTLDWKKTVDTKNLKFLCGLFPQFVN